MKLEEKIQDKNKKSFILPNNSIGEGYKSKINKVVAFLKKKRLIFSLFLQVKIMLVVQHKRRRL